MSLEMTLIGSMVMAVDSGKYTRRACMDCQPAEIWKRALCYLYGTDGSTNVESLFRDFAHEELCWQMYARSNNPLAGRLLLSLEPPIGAAV